MMSEFGFDGLKPMEIECEVCRCKVPDPFFIAHLENCYVGLPSIEEIKAHCSQCPFKTARHTIQLLINHALVTGHDLTGVKFEFANFFEAEKKRLAELLRIGYSLKRKATGFAEQPNIKPEIGEADGYNTFLQALIKEDERSSDECRTLNNTATEIENSEGDPNLQSKENEDSGAKEPSQKKARKQSVRKSVPRFLLNASLQETTPSNGQNNPRLNATLQDDLMARKKIIMTEQEIANLSPTQMNFLEEQDESTMVVIVRNEEEKRLKLQETMKADYKCPGPPKQSLGKAMVCHLCKVTMTVGSTQGAIRHISTHDTELKPFKCVDCGYRTCRRTAIKRHATAKQSTCSGNFSENLSEEMQNKIRHLLLKAFPSIDWKGRKFFSDHSNE